MVAGSFGTALAKTLHHHRENRRGAVFPVDLETLEDSSSSDLGSVDLHVYSGLGIEAG